MKLPYPNYPRFILAGLYLFATIALCSYEKVAIDRAVDEHTELVSSTFIRKTDNLFYTLDMYMGSLVNEPVILSMMNEWNSTEKNASDKRIFLEDKKLTSLLDKYIGFSTSLENGAIKSIRLSMAGSHSRYDSYTYNGVSWEKENVEFNRDENIGLTRYGDAEEVYINKSVTFDGDYIGDVSFILGNQLIDSIEPFIFLREGLLEINYYINNDLWQSETQNQISSNILSDSVSSNVPYLGVNFKLNIMYSLITTYKQMFISIIIMTTLFFLNLTILNSKLSFSSKRKVYDGRAYNDNRSEYVKTSKRNLIHLPDHDQSNGELSKVMNKIEIMDRLRDEVMNAEHFNYKFSIILIDLDEYNVVNGCFGKVNEEYASKLVAESLKCSIRSTDAIGLYGDNKFLIIASNTKDRSNVISIVNRMKKSLVELTCYNNSNLSLTSSIGIALFPLDASSAEQLVHKASSDICHINLLEKV
ncbi:GGDEF domain-containing protein [Vibrio comitans]|uniref:GGDEF domain-containing protein n=1 Tax=Vibrio comitans NBRC 102076 TaxID=1219078 RepID=A0A4Y3IR39_9VIBR|nr:GGDEF domain-containing protein [Vibrio comitans]GEA61953.1 hypothetical protein VCO01S_31460 [Vibrio comitans NBRC 102076]